MLKSNQWTALLLALALFGCGVAAGALGHRYYSETVVSAKTTADFRQQYLNEMKSKLHLSGSQVDQLQTILDETKAKAKALRDHYHPDMVKIKEEQLSRVKSILTAQQVPAYEQLVAERERRARLQEDRDRQDDRMRRPGPPPTP